MIALVQVQKSQYIRPRALRKPEHAFILNVAPTIDSLIAQVAGLTATLGSGNVNSPLGFAFSRERIHQGNNRVGFEMSTLQSIEKAVQALSPEQLAAFRAWFVEYDQALWDAQLENDVASGRLDALADEALGDLRSGRCTDL